jgi:peptidoglycan/xylan/chitin deacetylase (PgdA/CDA1 family)
MWGQPQSSEQSVKRPLNHLPRGETRGWRSPISPVLTYHVITPVPTHYIYSASCRQFEGHLAWLAALSTGTAIHDVPVPEVTFDDGRTSDHEFALPILEKYRIRATFFVTCGLVESEPCFMTWKQVRHIASLGHAVQSHGWSHLLLTRANEAQLTHELKCSKKELEDRVGLPVTSLSLPGGRWSAKVLDACVQAGYERVYHSNPFQTFESPWGMRFIGRLMVRNSMSVRCLQAMVEGGNSIVFYYRAQHVLKETGKRMLGDQTYHHLWKTLVRIRESERDQGIEGRDCREPGEISSQTLP